MEINRVSLKSKDSYMIYLVKKTCGKDTQSLYINGMCVFPIKMKTPEEKGRKWFGRVCTVHTVGVLGCVEVASAVIVRMWV